MACALGSGGFRRIACVIWAACLCLCNVFVCNSACHVKSAKCKNGYCCCCNCNCCFICWPGKLDVLDFLVAILLFMLSASGDDFSVNVPVGQQVYYAPDCIYIAPLVSAASVNLFGRAVKFGVPRRVCVAIGVAESKINQLHIVVYAREHDVVGFNVEVQHLVFVQILYC